MKRWLIVTVFFLGALSCYQCAYPKKLSMRNKNVLEDKDLGVIYYFDAKDRIVAEKYFQNVRRSLHIAKQYLGAETAFDERAFLVRNLGNYNIPPEVSGVLQIPDPGNSTVEEEFVFLDDSVQGPVKRYLRSKCGTHFNDSGSSSEWIAFAVGIMCRDLGWNALFPDMAQKQLRGESQLIKGLGVFDLLHIPVGFQGNEDVGIGETHKDFKDIDLNTAEGRMMMSAFYEQAALAYWHHLEQGYGLGLTRDFLRRAQTIRRNRPDDEIDWNAVLSEMVGFDILPGITKLPEDEVIRSLDKFRETLKHPCAESFPYPYPEELCL